MEEFKIFYSWQSQHSKQRRTIEDALKATCKELTEEKISITPTIDRDTKNTSGSPNIIETVFQKINDSHLFIADVSIINGQTPNSNVLIELGYAIKSLGWNRIICVCDTSLGSLDILPFDIRGQRITTYDSVSKKACVSNLSRAFKSSVLKIYENFKKIESYDKNQILEHEQITFNNLSEVLIEDLLFDVICKICQNFSISIEDRCFLFKIDNKLLLPSFEFLDYDLKVEVELLHNKISNLCQIINNNFAKMDMWNVIGNKFYSVELFVLKDDKENYKNEIKNECEQIEKIYREYRKYIKVKLSR